MELLVLFWREWEKTGGCVSGNERVERKPVFTDATRSVYTQLLDLV